ncbi:MAG: hypothetical protein WC867_03620 [Candidatus Pacearchaeota archaeon]|jgi:hypothetical protein
MIININPDKEKSKSLIEMANITLKRLNELNIMKYPTNSVTDYYDIIHKYLEALALLNGIKIKGEGAHQELIDFISKKFSFKEVDRIFLQDMRDLRNRVSYEGFMIKTEYLDNNLNQINNIINSLDKIARSYLIV